MIDVDAARRYPVIDIRSAAALAIGVPALALLGYVLAADIRLAAGLLGLVVAGIWGAWCLQRPHTALPWTFPMMLLAGTKFRLRDATASLQGSLDAQVVMELGLFGLIGVGLAAAWYAAGDRRRLTTAEGTIAGFVGLALLSTAWSSEPTLTLVRSTQLAIIAGLAVAATRVLGPGRTLWLAIVSLAFYVLACAASTVVWEPLYPIDDPETRGRLSWFAVHPIDAGTLAALAALGLISAAWFVPRIRRVRLFGLSPGVLALPVTAILLLASTRGALAAFLCAVGLMVLLRLHPGVRWPAGLLGGALLLAAIAYGPNLRDLIAAVASENELLENVVLRDQSVDTVLAMNGRLQLWSDLVPAIMTNLFTGYGYQASRAVLLDTASWASYAHNAVLQTLLDLGIFGGLAMIAIIVMAIGGMRRADLGPWMRGAITALAVFLVVNSISTESFAAAPGIDVMILFLCAICAGWPRPSLSGARA